MEKIDQVLIQVLDIIVPLQSDRKKIKSLAKNLEKKLIREYKKEDIKANIGLEGSVAKDTWLREDPDIDIFIQLPLTIPRKDLDQTIMRIAKKATKNSKQVERYAEHPYLEAFVNDVRVNIVPCYQVDGGNWKSATDRTPYHTKYIKKHLSTDLKNEVRLLKKFFKGIDVYGAEIKTGGFSGYLCELLIIHYQSFMKTIEAFSKYKKKVVIDLQNFYSDKEVEPTLIFSNPLIVIDPVDRNRNVASALKSEKLYELIGAARAFINKPIKEFFFPPKINIFSLNTLKSKIENSGSSILFILLDNLNAVPDVLWGQLYRTQRSLRKLLKQNDFKVLRDAVWTNEKTFTVFIIEVETCKLPKIKQHIGPPLEFDEQCSAFLSKYMKNPSVVRGPFIKNKRWIVFLDRIYSDAKYLLKEKLISNNKNIGIPKLISKTLNKKLRILVDYEIAVLFQNNVEFASFLTSFLIGKPFWLKSN
jgi:tRNA nucleotidyltransferase (CCA-adding enzyme)